MCWRWTVAGWRDERNAEQPSVTHQSSASEKTLRVLEAALTQGRFTEVTHATGLAKATVHRIVGTLVEHEFVFVDGDGTYLPGARMLTLAGEAFKRVDISRLAAPMIDELVAVTGCTAHVAARSGDEAIYVTRRDSAKPYRMPSFVGKSIALHCTAIGKALLAAMDDDEVKNFLGRAGLPARTPNTITDPDRLVRDISEVRRRGYAVDDEENEPGIRCVGTVIRNHTGRVTHGLSVSTLALEHTRRQLEKFAPQTIEAAERISRALGDRAGSEGGL